LKNFFLITLVRLYRCFFRRRSKDRFERFLIVSTTGLGDTLWATPALRALRYQFPSAYIAILTSPLGSAVLKNNPYIDESFLMTDPALPSLIKLYPVLKQRMIDTVLIFHSSQRPILPFCHWLGANDIIGTETLHKGLDCLLTKKTPHKTEHEISRRLAIVAEVGAQPQGQTMEVFIAEKDEYSVDAFLKKKEIPSYLPMIGLHPGAKDLFKQWPPEEFIKIGKRLTEELGYQILITGNADEELLVSKIAQGIPRAIAICGQLTIHELAALQKRLHLLITNDTGPMHLAAAMGTPLLALFCPTNPTLCGPISNGKLEQIIMSPTCTPCLKKQCREPFCMLQISSTEVYAKAVSLLNPCL